jgi:hypothetical protein
VLVEVAIALVIIVFGSGTAGVAIAWLNDRRVAANARRVPRPDPKVLLGARLANGDIDDVEYARKMHLLLYGPPLEFDAPPPLPPQS